MIKWVLTVLLLLTGTAAASENCVEQYKGVCKDACLKGEIAAEGVFIDCGETQDCCVVDLKTEEPGLTGRETEEFAPTEPTDVAPAKDAE